MLKTLLKSVRQYRRLSWISPVLVLIEAAAETLIPFLMATMIDQGITPGNLNVIYRIGSWLLLAAIISLTSGASASWWSSKAAAGFATNLRQDLYYHIQTFAFENLDHFSTSSLITRLTTDITNLQNAYQMAIRIAFRAPSMLVFSIAMAFTVNAQMAMIFVVAIPILAVGLYLILHYARPLFRRVFRAYDGLNQVVRENLHGVRVVKTYGRQAAEEQKFQKASQQIFQLFSKAQRIMALNMPLMQFVMNTTMLATFWFGARLIIAHQMQTGELISLFAYSMSILFSLNMLAMIFGQLSLSQASAERVVAVLNTKPALTSPEQPLTTVANGAIDFQDVSFSYENDPTKLQLTDLNLHIKSGQLVGIVGGTGSGKSTLVELIPRLYAATKGTVLVGGQPVQTYDLATLRDNVAMVLQNNVLFSGTIRENLLWGDAQATDQEIETAAQAAQATSFIEKMPQKYATPIEQNGQNVSGGQKQRLSIARALLKKPRILILDDSTSAVDTKTEAAIRHAFRTTLPNTTKLIISQRIASIADADLIVVLDHGHIVGTGTHAELAKNNRWYQALIRSQQRKSAGGDTDASTTN